MPYCFQVDAVTVCSTSSFLTIFDVGVFLQVLFEIADIFSLAQTLNGLKLVNAETN